MFDLVEVLLFLVYYIIFLCRRLDVKIRVVLVENDFDVLLYDLIDFYSILLSFIFNVFKIVISEG